MNTYQACQAAATAVNAAQPTVPATDQDSSDKLAAAYQLIGEVQAKYQGQ